MGPSGLVSQGGWPKAEEEIKAMLARAREEEATPVAVAERVGWIAAVCVCVCVCVCVSVCVCVCVYTYVCMRALYLYKFYCRGQQSSCKRLLQNNQIDKKVK